MPLPAAFRAMKPATAAVLLGLGVAMVPGQAAFSQLYKWTDDQGRTHYSDKSPDRGSAKKLELKINSISGPAIVSKMAKNAAAVDKRPVRMLSTTWCGYCKRARAYLSGKGIAFEDLDVEKSGAGRQEYTALRGRGVPIILVGDQRMDGYDPSVLDRMLRAAGY
jgi:glutaredoxin